MTALVECPVRLPGWLPDKALLYLRHTEEGLTIRELARREGRHASTVLRQVRAYENRRDDPLVDEALDRLGRLHARLMRTSISIPTASETTAPEKDLLHMTAAIRTTPEIVDEATVNKEAHRILRRLCEPGAILAVSSELDKAVVVKGEVRTAVVDRGIAQVFALKDWISVKSPGRVTTYQITGAGRAALKRLLSETEGGRGTSEASMPFADQHRIWAERNIMEDGHESPRRLRYNLAESPLAALARRRDRDGELFLTQDLVTAGERLREDFELAQMGPRVTQNWDKFLTGSDRGAPQPGHGMSEGSARARDRVAAALRELGPGLGDMVLRVCCFLEGLEAAEKRLGWSARSGKIVLRIALMRLMRHYEETYGSRPPMIG
ncbi:helix-turn-helix domain-containing protein [Defluviimonas sp. WL0002]|uniref:Helix-turn-helix domain-containing protein n=1 Tax=Albidovulum marisflavi TaxID=2984159 RepID=A0ABT2ZG77_9RHOB|nr:helix-turn-helix domain-containing protein [Defluviimonas sp. WL0002]MCV2870022.1 helix-turn-helix domain-containing protein [Defluviimonas sp. WL0002]